MTHKFRAEAGIQAQNSAGVIITQFLFKEPTETFSKKWKMPTTNTSQSHEKHSVFDIVHKRSNHTMFEHD